MRRRTRRSAAACRSAEGADRPRACSGKEHVEWDNPFDVGMTGLIGFASGYHAMEILRHAADAGHRLSLPAVLPAPAPGSPRSTCAARTIGRRAPVDLGPDRRCRRDAGRAAAAPDAKDRSCAPRRSGRALPRSAPGPGRTGDRAPGRRASPAAYRARAQRIGQPTTPSSPATSACRRYGRRAIWR